MKSKSNKKNNSYINMIFCFLLVASVMCFIIFFIKHFYFNPPALQDTVKATTLGQLGDFIGGILNPIFGFLTVGLLLWSIFIQRKELALTRDELEKSAAALDAQVKISRKEYNRKQLEDAANSYLKKMEYLFNVKMYFHGGKMFSSNTASPIPNVSLNDMLYDSSIDDTYIKSKTTHNAIINIRFEQIKETLQHLKICVLELTKEEGYVEIDILKHYWINKTLGIIDDCHILYIFDDREAELYKIGLISAFEEDK